MTIPIVVTSAGLTPQTPDSLRTQLIALVAAAQPGYTANLPGSLIADVSGTAVAAVSLCDSAMVESVNNVTPYGANEQVLAQQGAIYGVPPGKDVNTSVNVVFTGTPGFPIPIGFTVSDGSYQYVVQDNGVVQTAAAGQTLGTSPVLGAVATATGSWAVPAGSVDQLVTQPPTGITLTVTNPVAGTPATTTQTPEDYRSQVLQAGLAAVQGGPRFLKTQILNVAGVVPRLVAVRQMTTSTFEVIVGGGDPYAVANAIFNGWGDITALVGSATTARNVVVQIPDYPDTYSVTFVNPPLQTVGVELTWNTSSTNFVSSAAVATLGSPAIVAYINSLPVGAPINVFELQATFQAAVSSVVATQLLSRMIFTVTINGTAVSPTTGTGLIEGDPESYFQASTSTVTITQG